MPRKAAVEAFKAEHGDQQGADAEIWGRKPVQVSGRILGLTRHVTSPLVSLRASTDRKTKETVALELSFVNSNLQLLKEQLAELNSSVEVKSDGLVGFPRREYCRCTKQSRQATSQRCR